MEHWDNAVSQGQHWARVVLGGRQPFVHVPYFFSDVFDLSYELSGDPAGASEIEERQVAPEWIKSRQKVSSERLSDKSRSTLEATNAMQFVDVPIDLSIFGVQGKYL